MLRPHRFLSRVCLPSLLAASCATPPTPEAPPPLLIESAHYSGSVRSGPLASRDRDDTGLTAADEEQAPWKATLDVQYVDVISREYGVPVTQLASSVVADDTSDPVRSLADLARGLRGGNEPPPIMNGANGVSSASTANEPWTHTQDGVLWPGVTVSFQAELGIFEGAPVATWDGFRVELARRAGGAGTIDDGTLELALVLSGEVATREAPDEEDPTIRSSGEQTPRTEHIVLDPHGLGEGRSLYLLLPAPSLEAPEGGLVVEVRIDSASAPAEELTAAARDEIRLARLRADERVGRLEPNEGFRRQSGSALRALEVASLQRPALVFLSRMADAPLLADVALVASDAELELFTLSLGETVSTEHDGRDGELDPLAYQWIFESAAWRWAATRTSEGVVDPPVELRALLLRHAGEAGRYPDIVLDTVASCASVVELTARIESENTIFLEDGNPGARVRAFDWLAERRLAPRDYDPLGTRADRRAALAALYAEAEEASAPTTGVEATGTEEDAR